MKASIGLFAVLANLGSATLGHPSTQSVATDKKFADDRVAISVPKYDLKRVRALLKELDGRGYGAALTNFQFKYLTVEEKFTYCMLHGEWPTQGCFVMPAVSGDGTVIYAYPPNGFADESRWSDRQRRFLRDNRPIVDKLFRETVQAENRVGVNLKMAITEVNAVELIPDILSIYRKDRRDQDILSECMVLMTTAHYKPFMATKIYKELYTSHWNYKTSIPATRENEDRIIKQASAFAKSKGF